MNLYLILFIIKSVLLTDRNVPDTDEPPSYEDAIKMYKPQLEDLPVAVNQDLRGFQIHECANESNVNRNLRPSTRNEERHDSINENPQLAQITNQNETVITIENINREILFTNEYRRFVNNTNSFERRTKTSIFMSLYNYKFSMIFFLASGILLGFACYYANSHLLVGFAVSFFMFFICFRLEDDETPNPPIYQL